LGRKGSPSSLPHHLTSLGPPRANSRVARSRADTAYRKAWTSITFRSDTTELAKLSESGEAWALRNVEGVMPLGGGVRIIAGDGDTVGAIGVSGAPAGSEDDACAKAGIQAISEDIQF